MNENAKRGIVFWSLPNVLIIDLKRWGSNLKKVSTLVDVPLTHIDLSRYIKGYNSQKYIYELYGTCNHSGNVGGGHYTACVKNMNGKWYHFNDTIVENISDNNVITSNCYCLFFRKIK